MADKDENFFLDNRAKTAILVELSESPTCFSNVMSSCFFSSEQLRIIGITASNTWGLLLLILLMGYGLIELPRSAWNMSVPGFLLSQTLFKISKLSTEKEDVEEELTETLQVFLLPLLLFSYFVQK